MNDKLKYILYARKSQESKDRQIMSISSQISELREFAVRNNIEIVKEMQESQSAYKTGRPVYAEMINLIEAGFANAILVWKPDRLARNAIDGAKIIYAMDSSLLREIRTPYEVLKDTDNRLMLYIHFGMSNDYSRQISSNVKRGNREKYKRGEYIGRAPVGYLNGVIDKSKNIVLDPIKSIQTKKLFEEYSTGIYSITDIVKLAQKWGLTGSGGKLIVKSVMYKILNNPVYCGMYNHGGELHVGSYEPLITKELFDKVQKVLRDKSKPKRLNWINHPYKDKLIKCGECGCSITAETKTKYYKSTGRKGIYTYYRCTKRRGYCSQKPITEIEMEKMLKDNISKIEIDKEVWNLGVKLLKAKYSDEVNLTILNRKVIEQESVKIDKDLERLLHLRMDEEISSEEYTTSKKVLLDKKLINNEKLSDREQSSSDWLELSENFFETALQARKIMEGDDKQRKRDLVQSVGWNLILRDKKLDFSFKKPYDILLKSSSRSDVLRD